MGFKSRYVACAVTFLSEARNVAKFGYEVRIMSRNGTTL